MDGGTVTTQGGDAHGLYAWATNASNEATATAWLTGGDIKTSGDVAYGLHALTEGLGAATAQMDGGTVTTQGRNAYGLLASADNASSEAAATAWLTGGDIKTSGDVAYGLHALTEGLGAATAQMDGGTVTTQGRNAYGLYAQSAKGQAVVILGADAVLAASGIDADGIRAESATGYDVDVAGHVSGGAGDGAAIHTISSAGGTVDIASGATVNGSTSGIALLDDGGAAVITSAGTVTGDTRLGASDDALLLTGGSFTGDIYGGNGNDAFGWRTGTLTGGFYGGDGADTATVSASAYDGTQILDGGDGDADALTLSGVTMTATANSLLNWEEVTLGAVTVMSEGASFTLNAALISIDASSTFDASAGGITIAGNVTNAGLLTAQNGVTGDVITIDGDYSGSGGTVALDAVLNADTQETGMLVVTGSTSGDTTLLITDLGGSGTVTSLDIEVVSVGADANGTFTLAGGNYVTSDGEQAVIAGAYVYTLVAAEDGSGWVLNAGLEGDESYSPAAPIYDSYAQSLLALNGPSSLRQRGSAQDYRSRASGGGAVAVPQSDTSVQQTGSPFWIQMGVEQITSGGDNSTTDASRTSSIWEMEMGADTILNDTEFGFLVGGLMLSYATGSTDIASDFGDGSIQTTGLGLGLAATWYDYRGFYVDGQVTYTSYESDLVSTELGNLMSGNSGTGLALSIEAGKQFELASGLALIPQAQLSLSSVAFDDFTGPMGELVTLTDADSKQLRLGLEFGQFTARADGGQRLYGIVNVFHEFGAGSGVDVSGVPLTTAGESWAAGFGFGGSYTWEDRYAIFGEATYATGLSAIGDSSAFSANFGFKMMF